MLLASLIFASGGVSKTSVCEATELTGFSKSMGCFSPGLCSTTWSRLRPCLARMGCSASCRRLVGLAEIRTTRSRPTNSSLHGTLELQTDRDPGPFPPNKSKGDKAKWESATV